MHTMSKPRSGAGITRVAAAVLLAAAASGCALHSHVSISPLHLKPGDVTPPASSVSELVSLGDYSRALAWAPRVLNHPKPHWRELAALGRAYASTGRSDQARIVLRRALLEKPPGADAALIAWEISQVEFLENDFTAAREWLDVARRMGVSVRPWYPGFLDAMANVSAYRVEGAPEVRLPMRSVRPEVPRIDVRLNAADPIEAVIDSGAVLSIISEGLAERSGVHVFSGLEGTFYGLLGEPIAVRFGLIDSLQLGAMTLRSVPVAIMPDQKLSFLVGKDDRLQMDLLLGANLLKEFRLELDFWRETAVFTHIPRALRRPEADANLFMVNFRPFVHATIENRGWYLFVLDTGSEITYLNESELIKTRVFKAPRSHRARLQGLGGAQKQGFKVERISIGLHEWSGKFRDIPLYNSDAGDSVGIIGEDFLRNFRVVIDFGRMRVDLHRQPGMDPYTRMQQQTMTTQTDYP